jgi:hypothetical protein
VLAALAPSASAELAFPQSTAVGAIPARDLDGAILWSASGKSQWVDLVNIRVTEWIGVGVGYRAGRRGRPDRCGSARST